MPSQRLTTLPVRVRGDERAVPRGLDVAWPACRARSPRRPASTPWRPAPGRAGSHAGAGRPRAASRSRPSGTAVPSLTGLSGSPSIWSSSTLPFRRLAWCRRAARSPTAQYGHTECEPWRPRCADSCLTVVASATAASKPRAESPPTAAPAAPTFRISRRVNSGTTPPLRGARAAVSPGDRRSYARIAARQPAVLGHGARERKRLVQQHSRRRTPAPAAASAGRAIEALGGHLTLASPKGAATTVRANLPVRTTPEGARRSGRWSWREDAPLTRMCAPRLLRPVADRCDGP